MRILGVDYGEARTGLSMCDPTGLLASPLHTIHERKREKAAAEIARVCGEYNVEKIILGYPKNTNNTLGERAARTMEFKELLESLLPHIPVILWDERYSTKSAIGILNTTNTRGKKRKEVLDSVAATLILESYLNSVK